MRLFRRVLLTSPRASIRDCGECDRVGILMVGRSAAIEAAGTTFLQAPVSFGLLDMLPL